MQVGTSNQTERQAGREAWGGEGEHSSSAFSKIADWLPPASAQEPGNRQHTFLPLIAADETLMLPLSSQYLAHAKLLRSKPQQCVVAECGMPNLGRAQIRYRRTQILCAFYMTLVFD